MKMKQVANNYGHSVRTRKDGFSAGSIEKALKALKDAQFWLAKAGAPKALEKCKATRRSAEGALRSAYQFAKLCPSGVHTPICHCGTKICDCEACNARLIPICAVAMGCLCAWHGAGASAQEPCDTDEVRAAEFLRRENGESP